MRPGPTVNQVCSMVQPRVGSGCGSEFFFAYPPTARMAAALTPGATAAADPWDHPQQVDQALLAELGEQPEACLPC